MFDLQDKERGKDAVTENQKLSSTDLRKYRIELPNLYDDLGLDVYEFRLLVHYVRVGNCWESVRTTAKKCNMSHPKVIQARNSLKDKGLILTKQNLKTSTIDINIVDKWLENFMCYSGSQVEQGGHEIERGGHEVETKKEPIKKRTIEELEKHFSDISLLSLPDWENNPKVAQKRWRTPIRNMLKETKKDMGATKEFMTRAVRQMRKEKLTLSAPQSIEKIFVSLYSESKSEKGLPNAAALRERS